MRLFFVLSLALVCAVDIPIAHAQGSFTVDQAVELAIKQNHRLRAATSDSLAARAAVTSAKAAANPEIVFVPAITGPAGSDTELLIQQPLEINGARSARTRVAEAQRAAVDAAGGVELRSLVLRVKSAYYELLRARNGVDVARTQLGSAREFDQLTRKQVEAGARPGIDQIQTGIEVARAHQVVFAAERRQSTLEADLNTLMGRDPGATIAALTVVTVPQAPSPVKALLAQALASRPEIAVEAANRDMFLAQGQQARAEGRIDIVPQFRVGRVTGGKVEDAGIGVGISLPLFDFGSRRGRVSQAAHSAQAQSERIAAVSAETERDVILAAHRLETALAEIASYQSGILDSTKQLLDASRTGFREGRTSIIAVLEAQRVNGAVQTGYSDALVDAALAQAQLEFATGTISPKLLTLAATNGAAQ
ncbi:MAG TPA: TolC family protein [Capsulimonadaceae bacterium]